LENDGKEKIRGGINASEWGRRPKIGQKSVTYFLNDP